MKKKCSNGWSQCVNLEVKFTTTRIRAAGIFDNEEVISVEALAEMNPQGLSDDAIQTTASSLGRI